MRTVNIKRIYDKLSQSETEEYKVLVDRLWPRGISKNKIDEWDKDIAPSTELRKWFDHKAERFKKFSRLYREELMSKEKELNKLRDLSKTKAVTLLYGAKDAKINHAVILRDLLLMK
ncbi:MAG: DUF488 family protein [Bacteroidia bacterium]